MIRVGVIEQRAFVNILRRIAMHAKTGLLTLIHNKQEVELYFEQGQLRSIGLKESPPLGERLVQAGVISQDDLQKVLLTLAASDAPSHHLKEGSDALVGQILTQLGLVSSERLSAWITQEAVAVLQDLLTWSESEVSFVENVQAPTDYIPLGDRVNSLISSLAKDDVTSQLSHEVPKPVKGKFSLPTVPVTPPVIKKTLPVAKDAANVRTLDPTLPKTPPAGIQRFSLPIKRFPSTEGDASPERVSTPTVKVSKRDPHLEMLNTVSITALRPITHPQKMKNLKLRVTGIIFIGIALFYIPWTFEALNGDILWFSLPFLFATLYMTILIIIAIYNNWNRSVPQLFKLPNDVEPVVAILVPTCGEPVEMVQKTIESVLNQNWPQEAMLVIVGDDSHNPKMQSMAEDLQRKYPTSRIIYHLPPSKDSPERMGKAKAGNLNSMLKLLTENYPDVHYVETRDADDLVGHADFLRYTIGHLVSNPKAAYVQTIKEALVSPGDPFGNQQPTFYRGLMLSKHATNSVFPCGSGLVWSKWPLDKIGGFPTWNVVEDLYSGYVAMQHGFKGSYLPIVGAIGQVAPEDIPNVYKQLGTWALDTVRMFVWKNPWLVKGLTFQQRMHFTEMGLFYISSFVQLILFITPPICLFSGQYPLRANNSIVFVILLLVNTLIIDSFVLFLGHDITLKDHWRTRQLCINMMFVYMKAGLLAFFYGPHKKPVYKVTRKDRIIGLYFKEMAGHILLFFFLFCAIIYNFLIHWGTIDKVDFGSVFWALLYMVLLSGVISKSWYGVTLSQLLNRKKRTPSL
jgi:cellulose synthase (UDP-forming)